MRTGIILVLTLGFTLPCLAFQGAAGLVNITGDWNVVAKLADGTPQYGAWRIRQQNNNLEVISRWAHVEALREGSGTLSESGRVLIIGGPAEGWMESFSGVVAAGGMEISGTFSRVEGVQSVKGTFVAQRRKESEMAEPQRAEPERNPPPSKGTGLIEAPGSPAESRSAPAASPAVREAEPAAPVPTAPATPALEPGPPSPPGTERIPRAAPGAASAPDHPPAAAQDLAELERLLTALIEQNKLVIRQASDVRNRSASKDQQLAAQVQRQQRIFRLIEKLIHSKVEMEELMELFRRSPQP